MESYSREALKAIYATRLKNELARFVQPFIDDIFQCVLAYAEKGNTRFEYDNPLLADSYHKFTAQLTFEQFLDEVKKMLEAKFPDSTIETDSMTGKIKISWD